MSEEASHVEEQALEIEALQSIYMDDLQELENEAAHPSQWNATPSADGASQSLSRDSKPVYMIQVYPQREDDNGGPKDDVSSHEFGIELYFAHTVGYPDVFPLVHVSSIRGLSVDQVSQCAAAVSSAVDENAGMPMIFSLVTAVQDWVNGLAEAQQSEAKANDPKEQELRRRMEEEERIQKLRKHGHEVTVDSFLAWREQFLAETASLEAASVEKGESAKMTGKAWFLQQQTPVELEVEEYEEYEEATFVDSDGEDGEEDGHGEASFSLTDSDSDEDDLLDELEANIG